MKNLFLILLTVVTTCLPAQQLWERGHIITREGERLEGLLITPAGNQELDRVRYRPGSRGRQTVFTPDELAGFATASREYVSREIYYDPAPNRLARMEVGRQYPDVSKRAFLEVIYDRPTALLRYVDPAGQDHFYLQLGGQPLEYLRYELHLMDDNGSRYLTQSNSFREQLEEHLADCPGALEVLSAANYEAAALTEVIGAYRACLGESPEAVVTTRPGGRWSFGIMGGGMVPILYFSSATMALPGPGYHSAGLSPTVGLTLAYTPANRRLSPRLRIRYEQFDAEAANPVTTSNVDPEDYPTHLLQQTVYTNLGISYQVSSGRFPLLFDGGATYGHILKNERRMYRLYFVLDPEEEVRSYDKGGDFGVSAAVGTQVANLRLSLEASYVDRMTEVSYSTWRVGALATYFF